MIAGASGVAVAIMKSGRLWIYFKVRLCSSAVGWL